MKDDVRSLHSSPPTEPGGSCDWGWCDRPFHSWRWADDLHEWLPVCSNHRDRDRYPGKNQRADRTA